MEIYIVIMWVFEGDWEIHGLYIGSAKTYSEALKVCEKHNEGGFGLLSKDEMTYSTKDSAGDDPPQSPVPKSDAMPLNRNRYEIRKVIL